jgi:hypothetical protein
VNGNTVVITNAGLIQNLGTGRAVQAPSGGGTTRDITLDNSGTIRSADDAFRINVNVTAGTITINNSGTMASTGGQVIDFAAISTAGATISINNLAGGVIQSGGEDAVRPGKNATVTNWGKITSGSGGDGVDVQTNGGTVINKSGGEISAGKHGINVGVNGNVTVINEAGATIIGRNGSGVGSDGYGTVTNYGRITGDYDEISATGDGDGVDIDIDIEGHIYNYGINRADFEQSTGLVVEYVAAASEVDVADDAARIDQLVVIVADDLQRIAHETDDGAGVLDIDRAVGTIAVAVVYENAPVVAGDQRAGIVPDDAAAHGDAFGVIGHPVGTSALDAQRRCRQHDQQRGHDRARRHRQHRNDDPDGKAVAEQHGCAGDRSRRSRECRRSDQRYGDSLAERQHQADGRRHLDLERHRHGALGGGRHLDRRPIAQPRARGATG